HVGICFFILMENGSHASSVNRDTDRSGIVKFFLESPGLQVANGLIAAGGLFLLVVFFFIAFLGIASSYTDVHLPVSYGETIGPHIGKIVINGTAYAGNSGKNTH